MAGAIRAAARQAYLDAFGVAMFIAAGFAGLSAFAGLLIDPEQASSIRSAARAAQE